MVTIDTAFLQATFAPIFELIDAAGEDIVIRENTAIGVWTDHPPIKAKPNPIRITDLIPGSIVRIGDFLLLVRAENFPVARLLENKDRITFRGRDYGVINDDPHQYSIGGHTYVRVLLVRG